MTFNPGSQLDPGQVSDRRGMGGVAIGGGGAIGIILLLAYTLLGGNPNDLGPLLEPGAVTGPESSALATDCKTGQDANARDDCRILGYVNWIQKYWTDRSPRPASSISRSTRSCSRRHEQRLRHRDVGERPVLLPGRQARLPRPRLLPGAALALRRERGLARAGLRRRPRIRPPRPGPPRPPADERRRPDRRREPLRPDRAPGRLLRRRLDQPRGVHRLSRADHRRPDRGRARCRRGGRRRPHPGGDAGPGGPRLVDARLVGAAPEVVHDRLPERRPGEVRHSPARSDASRLLAPLAGRRT